MLTKTVKCGKKKGEYCRLHNPTPTVDSGVNRNEFIRASMMDYKKRKFSGKKPLCKGEDELILETQAKLQREREAEATAKHAFIVEDMRKNLNLTIDPETGTKTVSVYRSGVPTAPTERGVEKLSYANADEHLPENRQGRTTGLFASPTLHGVTRWVQGNDSIIEDIGVRELRVNPDEVYVYSVMAWQRASANYFDGKPESHFASKYWETGMTLTDWCQRASVDPSMDPQEWELLLSPENVSGVKTVSDKSVAEASGPEGSTFSNSNTLLSILTRNKVHLNKG